MTMVNSGLKRLGAQNTFNKPITVVSDALGRIAMEIVIIIKDNDIRNMGKNAWSIFS